MAPSSRYQFKMVVATLCPRRDLELELLACSVPKGSFAVDDPVEVAEN